MILEIAADLKLYLHFRLYMKHSAKYFEFILEQLVILQAFDIFYLFFFLIRLFELV